MSPEEQKDWIEQTMFDLKNGLATTEQTDTLRKLLLECKDARTSYLQSNWLDYQLDLLHSNTENFEIPKISKPLKKIPPKKQFKLSHLTCTLAGAGVTAAIVLMIKTGGMNPPGANTSVPTVPKPLVPVASLESDYNANISGDAATSENTFDTGKLNLDRGIAQLEFRNGAQIVLDGECGFEILDDKTVVLTHGKMWTYCPPEAYGFTVMTPGGRKIVDLGTEFGVEITREGNTNVHVLSGLVDIVTSNDESKLLESGKSARWDVSSGDLQVSKADVHKFISSHDLAEKRLAKHRKTMLKRDDLLIYYDFSSKKGHTVRNQASVENASSYDGTILGGTLVSGRSQKTKALQTDKPGDGICLKINRPKEITNYTIAMWVKLDRMEHSLATLINTDYWNKDGAHFQINKSFGLQAGIYNGPAFHSNSNVVTQGRWHLVAVSWDFKQEIANLYCDGKILPARHVGNGSERIPGTIPNLGNCQIGGWYSRPYDKRRDFNGRIDEFMFFDHALDEEEIMLLYLSGRP